MTASTSGTQTPSSDDDTLVNGLILGLKGLSKLQQSTSGTGTPDGSIHASSTTASSIKGASSRSGRGPGTPHSASTSSLGSRGSSARTTPNSKTPKRARGSGRSSPGSSKTSLRVRFDEAAPRDAPDETSVPAPRFAAEGGDDGLTTVHEDPAAKYFDEDLLMEPDDRPLTASSKEVQKLVISAQGLMRDAEAAHRRAMRTVATKEVAKVGLAARSFVAPPFHQRSVTPPPRGYDNQHAQYTLLTQEYSLTQDSLADFASGPHEEMPPTPPSSALGSASATAASLAAETVHSPDRRSWRRQAATCPGFPAAPPVLSAPATSPSGPRQPTAFLDGSLQGIMDESHYLLKQILEEEWTEAEGFEEWRSAAVASATEDAVASAMENVDLLATDWRSALIARKMEEFEAWRTKLLAMPTPRRMEGGGGGRAAPGAGERGAAASRAPSTERVSA